VLHKKYLSVTQHNKYNEYAIVSNSFLSLKMDRIVNGNSYYLLPSALADGYNANILLFKPGLQPHKNYL